MRSLAILDFGVGNLNSVHKLFHHCANDCDFNLKIDIVEKAEQLKDYDYFVLPGDGAYGEVIKKLHQKNELLNEMQQQIIKCAKPYLGICVGMHVLSTIGNEFGEHKGLNWIPGKVKLMTPSQGCYVPHIGWNIMENKETHPHHLLRNISGNKKQCYAYFLHSYAFECETPHLHEYCYTMHGNNKISTLIVKDNVAGVQFHPEKSLAVGKQLISNFLKWNR